MVLVVVVVVVIVVVVVRCGVNGFEDLQVTEFAGVLPQRDAHAGFG